MSRKKIIVISVSQILDFVGSDALSSDITNPNLVVWPSSLEKASDEAMVFVSPKSRDRRFADLESLNVHCGLLIRPPGGKIPGVSAENWIRVNDPRTIFALICRNFYSTLDKNQPFSFFSVSRFASIIRIPEFLRGFLNQTRQSAGVGQLPTSNIFVSIGEETTIGNGTVIGGDGFGFVRDRSGRLLRFPHYGGVRIGNRCEIGANCTIDRAVFGDTTIGDDVKIDNLVHIGHNVQVGSGTAIAAGTVIGGSTVVGNNVWIGPGSVLKDKITIGDNSIIGLGSVVISSVPAGKKVFGNPAQVISG